MKQIALAMALLGMQVTLQQSYGTSCTFPVVSIELEQRSGTYDNIEDFLIIVKAREIAIATYWMAPHLMVPLKN